MGVDHLFFIVRELILKYEVHKLSKLTSFWNVWANGKLQISEAIINKWIMN